MSIKFFSQNFKKIFRFLPLIFLFLAFLGGLLLIWPSWKQIQSLKQQITRQENVLASQQANLAAVHEFRETFQQTKLDIEKINQILPIQESIPNLLVQLESAALESGLIFKSINFSTQNKEEQETDSIISDLAPDTEEENQRQNRVISYKITSIDLAIEASYKNLKKYLSVLENNLRIMDVVSISIKNSITDKYLINLKINVYHR